MYLKLKEGEQSRILKAAIKKAGSQRELAKILNIPYQSIGGYALCKRMLTDYRLNKISRFIGIKNKEDLIEERLEDNWKQIKGGKSCVLAKKKKGTFNKDMKVLQDIQSIKLKKWHKFMKNNNPIEYYNLQYSRFKKIGGYKHRTLNGEKVRNYLEKNVANYLFKNKIKYQYEPLIRVKNSFFFPDFLLENNIIIECTMWRGLEKCYKLLEKIKALEKDYKVYVVIPKALYTYYRLLDNNILFAEELCLHSSDFSRK